MNKAVISDTSCLIALAKIDKLDLLRELYQEIVITREVNLEFGYLLPEWILIKEPVNKQKQSEQGFRLSDKLIDKIIKQYHRK